MENKVLIVVDMQNDFIDGSLGSMDAQAIVPNVVSKIKEYKAKNLPIIFTQDTHFDSYLDTQEGEKLPIKHCIIYSKGWDLCNEIKEIIMGSDYPTINKESFGYDDWEDILWEFEEDAEIEIIGLDLDICVISNALIIKSIMPEARICIDLDCTAATSKEAFDATVKVLKSCQIDVIGENTND